MTKSARKSAERDRREAAAASKKAKIHEETDNALTEALDESFPASDPPSMAQPKTSVGMSQVKPLKKG